MINLLLEGILLNSGPDPHDPPDMGNDTLTGGFTYVDLSGLPDVRLHFYHSDHLGTHLFLTDSSGTVVWQGDYKPFGKITPNTDPDGDGKNVYQPFRFPGQYEDYETGLYYNYFRDYDPALGRYVEADPIGLDKALNNYPYGGNSPGIMIDPPGLAYYMGEASYLSGGLGIGGGFMEIELRGECINGRRKVAQYSVGLGGVTYGLYVGSSIFEFGYDDKRLTSEPDFDRFQGLSGLISWTGAVGSKGYSVGGFVMGPNLIDITGSVKGLDISLDSFLGLSVLDYVWEEDCCN